MQIVFTFRQFSRRVDSPFNFENMSNLKTKKKIFFAKNNNNNNNNSIGNKNNNNWTPVAKKKPSDTPKVGMIESKNDEIVFEINASVVCSFECERDMKAPR